MKAIVGQAIDPMHGNAYVYVRLIADDGQTLLEKQPDRWARTGGPGINEEEARVARVCSQLAWTVLNEEHEPHPAMAPPAPSN